VNKGEEGDHRRRCSPDRECRPQLQRRGRDRDGRDHQHGKGIVQASGQKQQKTKLRDVEDQHQEHRFFGQALVLGVDEDRHEIGDHRRADRQIAQPYVKCDVEGGLGHEDCGKLPANGDPAQDDQGAQPHPV
jgi:hypothetical protein